MNICGIMNVNLKYMDRHIRRQLGLLDEIILYFSLTVMVLHNGNDTLIRLNLLEAVK